MAEAKSNKSGKRASSAERGKMASGTPQVDEALRRIAECKAARATELDLGGLGLVEVPEEIGELIWLTALHLGFDAEVRQKPQYQRSRDAKKIRNAVRALPRAITALPHLLHLTLDGNLLTALPPDIGSLTALQVLSLAGNQLGTLPPDIGRLTALRTLFLNDNQLSALPADIGRLTALQNLYLDNNQLGALPSAIGRLASLETLSLEDNRLEALPPDIGLLAALRNLYLDNNQLSALPPDIGRLTALQRLYLDNNQLNALPPDIGRLTILQNLSLNHNRLTGLPPDIGCLSALRRLYLAGNRLTALPSAIGHLTALQRLYLAGNQLSALPLDMGRLAALGSLTLGSNPLPQAYLDALKQGTPAVLSYLRGLSTQDGRPIYEAKLLLTGEGEVGKTWLARALRGERNEMAAPKRSTFGVELGKVQVRARHASEGDVEITLNTWDFGGQKVYRILHQFFFSGDAIYLLVWKPRMGEEACQLSDWLRRIHLVAQDSARVILVATHAADQDQRYNSLGILRDVEPHLMKLVVDQIEVDSLTGHNIGALNALIAKHAVSLPRMGSPCPKAWERPLDEIAALRQRQPILSWQDFAARCAEGGLDEEATRTLAEVFVQQFGRALYFGDRRMAGERAAHLSDLIVLDPLWLSKAITHVLEDPATIAKGGLLDHDRLRAIWSDAVTYPVTRHPFLLGLMEKLDVSYTVRDHRTMSLIVQLLPQRRPDLPWYLASPEPADPSRELSIVCELGQEAPGIVPWLIAETHAYQVDAEDPTISGRPLAWEGGVFLRTKSRPSEAVIALTRSPLHRLHLVVRGQNPLFFFYELFSVLERTLARWPGLNPRFYVPCPEHNTDGMRCQGRFYFDALTSLPRDKDEDRCDGNPVHYVKVARLLTGLDALAPRLELDRPFVEHLAGAVVARVSEQIEDLRDDVDALSKSSINYLRTLWSGHQAAQAPCPRLFTLDVVEAKDEFKKQVDRLFRKTYALQLYCEQSLRPVGKPYEFEESPEWISKLKPLVRLVGPVVELLQVGEDKEAQRKLKDAGKFMDKLASQPDPSGHGSKLRHSEPFWASDADYRVLKTLLDKLDPSRAYRGMKQRLAPTNYVLWMSPEEAEVHRPIEPIIPGLPPAANSE